MYLLGQEDFNRLVCGLVGSSSLNQEKYKNGKGGCYTETFPTLMQNILFFFQFATDVPLYCLWDKKLIRQNFIPPSDTF